MSEPHELNPEPQRSRPQMPAGYGVDPAATAEMLPWSTVTAQLASARSYWLCTTRPDGRPHVAPVWGLWLDDAVHFSTDPTSRKGRNLTVNPACVVHLESGDDAVIIEGTVEPVTDPEVLARFVDAYDAKYHVRPDPMDPGSATYRVRPAVAFAWLEKSFLGSASRWRFTTRRD